MGTSPAQGPPVGLAWAYLEWAVALKIRCGVVLSMLNGGPSPGGIALENTPC